MVTACCKTVILKHYCVSVWKDVTEHNKRKFLNHNEKKWNVISYVQNDHGTIGPKQMYFYLVICVVSFILTKVFVVAGRECEAPRPPEDTRLTNLKLLYPLTGVDWSFWLRHLYHCLASIQLWNIFFYKVNIFQHNMLKSAFI